MNRVGKATVLGAPAAVLLLALALSACGGGSTSTSADTQSATTATTPETATGEAEGAAGGGEGSNGGEEKDESAGGGGDGKRAGSGGGEAGGGGSGESSPGGEAKETTPAPEGSAGTEGKSEGGAEQGGESSKQSGEAESGGGERAAVAAVLRAYLAVNVPTEPGKKCSYLAKRTLEELKKLGEGSSQFKSSSCPAMFKVAAAKAPEEARPISVGAIESVKINGSHATAIFKIEGKRVKMLLVKEGAAWKVITLAPVPVS